MKKAQRIKSHKIFVLMAMLSDELDEVEMLSENANAINRLSKELISKIDPYIDKIFKTFQESIKRPTFRRCKTK